MRIPIGLLVVSCANIALAQSVVRYTVGVGGNNHASAWKAGSPQMFSPGWYSDGQVFEAGEPLTWDVSAEASGVDSTGLPIWGVANFVFHLELRAGSADGPLAEQVRWFSTINDGTGGDPFETAAFALGFDVAGNGPGRVHDPRSLGGPRLDYYQHPSSKDWPVPNNPNVHEGMLVGMGAGYSSWDPEADNDTITTPGVGMVTLPNGQPGPGNGPLAEGQIDIIGLSPGMYFLKVIPGAGTNVLREDAVLGGSPYFALKADQTYGGEIMFMVVPEPATAACLLPALLLVGSGHRRRMH